MQQGDRCMGNAGCPLRALGSGFPIDDFGKRVIPLCASQRPAGQQPLKIDQGFVADLPGRLRPDSGHLQKPLSRWSELQPDHVAEGSKTQATTRVAQGYASAIIGQGYLYNSKKSKPQDAAHITAIWRSASRSRCRQVV